MSGANRYLTYYQHQGGGGYTGGAIQGLHGSVFQSGRGLGSIFRSLLKFVTPLWKPIGKSIGKEAIGMTGRIYNDIQAGLHPRDALKRNAREAAANLLNKVVDKTVRVQSGSGKRRRRTRIRRSVRKKRKTPVRKRKTLRKRYRRKKQKTDYLD